MRKSSLMIWVGNLISFRDKRAITVKRARSDGVFLSSSRKKKKIRATTNSSSQKNGFVRLIDVISISHFRPRASLETGTISPENYNGGIKCITHCCALLMEVNQTSYINLYVRYSFV